MSAGPSPTCRVTTLCLRGARAVPVEIELQFTGGLMQRIILTGLPGGALRESRDRIRGCLESCGMALPRKSVLASFAPADLHKEGNGFDLPLALGILALSGQVPAAALSGRAILGEVALDGRLRPVRGALLAALECQRRRIPALLLPAANGAEAGLVAGLRVEAVESLPQAIEVMAGAPPPPLPPPALAPVRHLDLADVRGQASARRALEIAAAGRHNLLLTGPPGTGKTMLAQRLPGLLPPLDERTALTVTALHGLLAHGPASVIRHPPFRAPHHSVLRAGLIGGGTPLQPGEISLAHAGVLFLDELPEWSRGLLEMLRQPIEERCVRLARAGHTIVFPARFQLLAAMNPCPCGFLGHPRKGCRCTPHQVAQYRQRISGPLLDRFDLFVEVPAPPACDLLAAAPAEASRRVAARVVAARAVQRSRTEIPPDPSVRACLEQAISGYGLSGRALRRTVGVARTIATLDGRREADVTDVEEALSLRRGLMSFRDAVALS